MMLAIVIPYYKLTFFEATLASLANQTNKKFKVYIGNDNSPEDPYNLLEKFTEKFDFTYHRFEDNLGAISLTKQWERCIHLSGEEEWIMILGDDDVLGNNVVEEFYDKIKEVINLEINIIRYQTIKINQKGEQISQIYKNPKIENISNFLNRKYTGYARSSLSEYIFSKNTLLRNKFIDFPLGWYADVVALIESSAFQNIYSINSSIVYVRYSTINISGKTDNIILKNKASVLFANYLLNNIYKFNAQNHIYFIVEKYYFNNKKEFKILFKMILYLAINLKIIFFLGLFFKLFKTIFYEIRGKS